MATARHAAPPVRPYLRLVLPAAGLALAAAAFLSVRLIQADPPAASAEPTPGPKPAADLGVPAFSFRLAKVESVAAGSKGDVGPQARESAREIRATLSRLHRAAFLDPGNWRAGAYDRAWALFEPDTAAAAEADAETLTLGPDAGAVYDNVVPVRGFVRVSLLMDGEGQPFTAAVAMRFTARATTGDGEIVLVVSRGQYFLRPTAEGWRVYGYEVERADRAPKGAAA